MYFDPRINLINEERHKDLIREAHQHRLARIAAGSQQSPSLVKAALTHIGNALISVGSRLKERPDIVQMPQTESATLFDLR
ncbi:MAG: hypothetical protein H6671_05105 [Anaerolineaceae bacterium]|nr:hypothetical protein [Anaerolineaceae bacterium]